MKQRIIEKMRWMDKEDVAYVYNGTLQSMKKNGILPFATT